MYFVLNYIYIYIYIYIYCESRLQSRLLMPRSSMLGLLRQTVVNFPVVQSTQNYKHGSNGRCVFSFAVSEKFKACECKHFPLHLLYRLQFVISSPIPCSLSPHRLEQWISEESKPDVFSDLCIILGTEGPFYVAVSMLLRCNYNGVDRVLFLLWRNICGDKNWLVARAKICRTLLMYSYR